MLNFHFQYSPNISALKISRCQYQSDIGMLQMIYSLINDFGVRSVKKVASSDYTQKENNSELQLYHHLVQKQWS